MSGPKGSDYSVRENRRREEARRSALREELARARGALDAAEEAAEAHAQAGAAVSVTPLRLSIDDGDASSIEAAIRSLRQRADEVRRESTAAVARLECERTLEQLMTGVDSSGALTAGEAMGSWTGGTPSPVVNTFDRARVEAALAQLDPDRADAQAELLDLADDLPSASPDTQRSIMEEIERRVRQFNREATQRHQELDAARELQMDLAGVAGASADELRARLAAVLSGDEPLDPRLADLVREAVVARRAVEDRLYVVESLRESLVKLGYTVGEDFVTDLGTHAVGYVERPGWSQHLLEVRLPVEADKVVMAAVREGDASAAPSASAATRDAEVEREFCDTFDPLEDQLSERGIHLGPIMRHPPGAHPMNVVQPTSKRIQARRTKQTPLKSMESP